MASGRPRDDSSVVSAKRRQRVHEVKCLLYYVMALGCFLAASTAAAQAYPTKPVRLVAPAAPGGGLDVVSRIIASKLADGWGQQVLVENRPGANMIVGTEAVAKSAPDGYTLLFASSQVVSIHPLLFPSLPY